MIAFENVSKSYDAHKALDKVSFKVEKGEIFGFLGPNGAGKTTTLNILSTLLDQDSGEIWVDGLSLADNKNECKLKIGVVPQEISLYEDLSAYDNLMFWGSLYSIPKKEAKIKINDVLKMVGLFDRRKDLIKTYSGGMKRRINIASSILHNPQVLLLDEPTAGVDPQSRNHIFELLERLNSEGMTIIYTTHYMEEVERLCNRIAIIDLGQIIAVGTLAELKQKSAIKDILSLTISELTEESVAELRKTTHFTLDKALRKLDIECHNIASEISEILDNIKDAGMAIEGIHTRQADLESIFLNMTGKQLRD